MRRDDFDDDEMFNDREDGADLTLKDLTKGSSVSKRALAANAMVQAI